MSAMKNWLGEEQRTVEGKVWQNGPRVIYRKATFKGFLTYMFRARVARAKRVFRPMPRTLGRSWSRLNVTEKSNWD